MRIAVAYESGNVFAHFGRTGQFKIYEIEDGQVTATRVVGTGGQGHGGADGCAACSGGGYSHLRRDRERSPDGAGSSRDPPVWRRVRQRRRSGAVAAGRKPVL